MPRQLLVDTRGNPKHCAFIAELDGTIEDGRVRVSRCCDACFKALKITLRLGQMAHLPVKRE